MYTIFDAHAHIYPEKIAVKAAHAIGDFYDIPMKYDGTVEHLLALGDEFGVQKFLVHSVATVEHQVTRINDFIIAECRAHPERFIGFATLHPDFENPFDELNRVKAEGLRGVKLHPDFQKFEISDPVMDEAYEAMAQLNLPVLFHTGDRRYHFSSPSHIPVIRRRHPHLKIICAHFGGYTEWDEAEKCLKGEDIWVDSSSSFFALGAERVRHLISLYGEERVLFGSDYPMWSVGDEIQNILSLNLPARVNEQIFSGNLSKLLNL